MPEFVVATLYRFVALRDAAAVRDELFALCRAHGVRGTLILASEGINGTVAGDRAGVTALLARLRADHRFDGLELKFGIAEEPPFHRLKVLLNEAADSPRRDASSGIGMYRRSGMMLRARADIVSKFAR